MKASFIRNIIAAISVLMISSVLSAAYGAKPVAVAPLAEDIQALLTEAQSLDAQIAGINLTDENLCSELLTAHQSADALVNNIESVNAGLSSPLSIDADSLQALDDLSSVVVNIGSSSTGLSLDVASLNTTTDMLKISSGITSMLRLADDIGTMADRILEMSDKILVMADNIGLMADRIITTQQIQSANLALTQASILATQQNVLALVSTTNSNVYNIDLNSQLVTGNFLSADIAATLLSQLTMAFQWANMASDVDSLKTQITATYNAIATASEANTMYADPATFTALAEMSIMMNAIAVAMEGQVLATEALSFTTGDATLTDSMGSILQMSADIGVMANSILEMADLILAMSDNIGLTADQIIAAQTLQSTNYAATLASVEALQLTAISIITVNSL